MTSQRDHNWTNPWNITSSNPWNLANDPWTMKPLQGIKVLKRYNPFNTCESQNLLKYTWNILKDPYNTSQKTLSPRNVCMTLLTSFKTSGFTSQQLLEPCPWSLEDPQQWNTIKEHLESLLDPPNTSGRSWVTLLLPTLNSQGSLKPPKSPVEHSLNPGHP